MLHLIIFNTLKKIYIYIYIKLYHDYSLKLLRTSPSYIHVIVNHVITLFRN